MRKQGSGTTYATDFLQAPITRSHIIICRGEIISNSQICSKVAPNKNYKKYHYINKKHALMWMLKLCNNKTVSVF